MKPWLPSFLLGTIAVALHIASDFRLFESTSAFVLDWNPFGLLLKVLGFEPQIDNHSLGLVMTVELANYFAGYFLLPYLLAGFLTARLQTVKPNYLAGSLSILLVYFLFNLEFLPFLAVVGFAVASPFLSVAYLAGIRLARCFKLVPREAQ